MRSRRTSIIIGLLFSLSLSLPYAHAASFRDVEPTLPAATAIETLKERGIVQGFPDGLFRPFNIVTRAEALKIALEGARIDTNSYATLPSDFSDVAESHTLFRYISYAARQGIVDGYGDGRFGPDNPVTRGEAAKILLRLNAITPDAPSVAPFTDTPLSLSLTPYIAYVADKNLLTTSGSTYKVDQGMTRADTAELMYRLIVVTEQKLDRFPSQTVATPAALDSNPVATGFFDSIVLREPLPTRYAAGEIYIIHGKLTTKLSKVVTAFLTNTVTGEQHFFQGGTVGDSFEVQISFPKPGTYSFGIIPGQNGASSTATISVVHAPDLPAPASGGLPDAPTALAVRNVNNHTIFSWSSPPHTITRLVITQGAQKVEHVLGVGQMQWSADFREFSDFSAGTVSWMVSSATSHSRSPLDRSSAWHESAASAFNAIQHQFSYIDTERVKIEKATWTLESPQVVQFSLTAIADVSPKIYLITPSDTITTSEIANGPIAPSTPISFTLPLHERGTYILEVNDTSNLAIINSPIYVGTDIPLLPDFHDREDGKPSVKNAPLTNQTREAVRESLLQKINEARAARGLDRLTMDDQLSRLAQKHVDDMISRGYFSHDAPEGSDPGDRAQTMNIVTPIGENIARTDSIESVHFGLFRSAAHRDNILSTLWNRVGIGVNVDSTGNYIVAEEFSVRDLSVTPLSPGEVATLRESLFAAINDKREALGVPRIDHDVTREKTLQDWLDEHGNSDLNGMLARIKNGRPVTLWSVSTIYQPQIAETLVPKTGGVIADTRWTAVSIGVTSESDRLIIISALIQ